MPGRCAARPRGGSFMRHFGTSVRSTVGVSLLGFAASTLLLSAPASGVNVVACGQIVRRGEVGDLLADLACPGGGVVLEAKAALNLNGHVVAGPGAGSGSCLFPDCGGVWCQGSRCTVEGPGEITGFPIGIFSQDPIDLARKGRVTAANLLLRGNNEGLRARSAGLSSVVARENGLGISAESCRLENVEASANGPLPLGLAVGIVGRTIRGGDVRVEGNLGAFGAIVATNVNLTRATVTGNAGDGIRVARRISLRDSTVTANATVDLSAPRRPRLTNTTCGSSSDQLSGDWDVCTND